MNTLLCPFLTLLISFGFGRISKLAPQTTKAAQMCPDVEVLGRNMRFMVKYMYCNDPIQFLISRHFAIKGLDMR